MSISIISVKKIIIPAVATAITISAMSAHADSGPAAFLNRGVGARALGMGGAFVAVSDDATAGYWNPAGLGRLDSIQVTAMFQKISDGGWPGMEDIMPGYQYFNFSFPLRKTGLLDYGSIALSVITMEINDIPHTSIDSSGSIIRETFSDKEAAVILSAGYPLIKDVFSLGFSLRRLNQDFVGISGASASGWDIQAGQILTLTDYITLGFSIERGPVLTWENGYKDTGNVKTKLGAGYEKKLSDKLNFLGVCDFIQVKNMPMQVSAGTEVAFDPKISSVPAIYARGGINRLTIEDRYSYMSNLNENIKWSLGFGIEFFYYNFILNMDYSYVNEPVGRDHLLSVTVRF